MAFTAQLVDSTPYRLRYIITDDGEQGPTTGTLPNGEMLADASPGPLKDLVQANDIGYPARASNFLIAVGAMTQGRARAIFNSDDSANILGSDPLLPRAQVDIRSRTGTARSWSADVNVDGNGDIVIDFAVSATGATTAYLDIYMRHTYDL